jgi:hypothetical protein
MGEWMYRSTVLKLAALVEGELSDSRPCRFTPGVGARGTKWMGRWVGPRTGLDGCSYRNSK